MADDKALIASSEFDPKNFINGINQMTDALEKLSVQEDKIRQDLANVNVALTANNKALKDNKAQMDALDKSSVTYQKDLAALAAQQQQLSQQQQALQANMKGSREQLNQVNSAAADYKNALTQLNAVAKQVAADNKGRTLFDIASMNQQVKDINAIGTKYKDLFKGKIDTKELEELEQKLIDAKDQFDELRITIDFFEKQLATLDPNSEEFRELSEVVNTGKQVLEDFGDVLDNNTKKAKPLASQLKEVRNQLQQMVKDGKEGTDEFKAMEKEAAELQEAIDKTGERIRTFANDTRLIQGGIEILKGYAAGFELVEGVTALFGIRNEAAEESIKRLTAIMAILNGLQEISNLLKKESIARLVVEEIATKALTISQRILAATLGTTAAASRALSVALAATGIGAIVVIIGLLVHALTEWANSAKEAEKAQKLLNVATEAGIRINDDFIDAVGDAGRQLAAQAELRQALAQKISTSELQNLRDRAKNAQELRDIEIRTLEEQLGEARSFEREERANYDRAADRRREALEGRIEISDKELEELGKTIENFNKIQTTGNQLENQLNLKRTNDLRDQARERLEIQKAQLVQYEDFLKRLEELRKRLLDAQNRQQRQDQVQLTKQAADNLKNELRKIDADVRKGSLTRSQGNILKNLLKQINGVELTTEIKEFKKKSLEAEQNIGDAITTLRLKIGEQRANLVRDELAQQAAINKETFLRESNELAVAERDALAGVQDALDQGLISPQKAQENSDKIRVIYQRLLNQLAEQTTRAQEALAAQAFEKAQENLRTIFANVQLFVSEAATEEINKLTQKYLAGKVSYEKYQKELTKIMQVESERRIRTAIREAEALLLGVQARIKAEQDPKRLKALQDQERDLRRQISDLKRQLNQVEVQGEQTDRKEFADKIQQIATYAQAVNNIVQAVVGFWQQANEAEQAQLDRSIAIQEKRVEAATRIAERGNAEYLRLEEDRLNELKVKQENAARRQLAINAVLQTSQALTAFVTALAQGIATGGPLGGLAIAAAVIGAIASGYAIIQSLRQEPQSFRKGTKRVERNGAPAGVDTVPAMLNEGEAVIPTDTNQQYKDAVSAIYDRSIPAEEMNAFVNSYRLNRRILPKVNGDRLGEVSNFVIGTDGKLVEATETQNKKLDEQADLLRQVHHQLKNMGFSVHLDRHGLAIAVAQALKRIDIDKKS